MWGCIEKRQLNHIITVIMAIIAQQSSTVISPQYFKMLNNWLVLILRGDHDVIGSLTPWVIIY